MVWCQAGDKPLLESTARWLIPCGDTRPQWVALMNSSCHVPSHVSKSNWHACCWWVDVGLAPGHLQPLGWPPDHDSRWTWVNIRLHWKGSVVILTFRTWPCRWLKCQGQVMAWYRTTANNALDFYSLSDKTSYRKISWRLEAVRFGFRLFVLLWNLAGTPAAALLRCLSNFRRIW